jgi:hypothetical protein
MQNLTENYAFDLGVVPQSLNNTNATGRYFKMAGHRRAVAVVLGGAAAAESTTTIAWLQATDEDGTSAKAITSASAEGTSGTKDTAATISLGSVAATDVVTINGVAFTCVASGAGALEFADDDELVTAIEASSIADQVSASASSDVVTLVARDGYAITLAKTENVGTITLATTQHIVMAEIDEKDLDIDNGFDCVAPRITVTGNGVYGVAVMRDMKKMPKTQNAQAVTAL